jgi:hypothetical protein
MSWELTGKFYGYPQCCIDEFVNHFGPFFLRPEEVQKTAQDGFLPCRNHAKEILSGKVKIEDIIKDRICSKPFPIDGMDDSGVEKELDAYIEANS